MAAASSTPAQLARQMPQSPCLYDPDGQGRLVVQNTFLHILGESEEEDEQPVSVRRSRTDSVLYGPQQGAMRCIDYRPGSPSTAASTPWVSDCEESAVAHGAAAARGRPDAGRAVAEASAQEPGEAAASAASGSRPGRGEPQTADRRTTVMMRNLPNSYTRATLLETLDGEGFAGAYDFVYLPMDFTRGCNLGYAFVNLVEPTGVARFRMAFNGYANWRLRTSKICQVTWSDRDQGLRANVKRYRNSPVMHPSVPDEYKPILFSEGLRVPFPAPHGRLQRPGGRRA